MPPRAICLVILLYWVVASSSLIRRDILPVLGFVRPPDLRAIALAEENPKPSRWSVEVIDNPLTPDSRRKVGEAVTGSKRFADGWVRITSTVWFDSGGLLLGTPFANRTSVRMEVKSDYRVDPSGNLRSFRATVKPADDAEELLRVEGELVKGIMEITTHGPLPILNQKRSYPYEPRSLVQNALGPIDRMPGLQVGQRWETRVVSPLTGQVEVVARRGGPADDDPVGPQPGGDLRGRAADDAALGADLGPPRRPGAPPGGPVPVRQAGPGAPARRPRPPGSSRSQGR